MRWMCAFLIAVLVVPGPLLADGPRVLGWEELVPATPAPLDPLAPLGMWERHDLEFVAAARTATAAGEIAKDGDDYRMAETLAQAMRAEGLDVDRLIAEMAAYEAAVAEHAVAVNTALEGALVRLPGYALPLTAQQTGVQEFLLVPFVGACIHFPPPPPNQVIRARLAAPHDFARRYEIVWLTGRLTAAASSLALDYVDGNAVVPTAWSFEVAAIEPYSSDPTAPTALGSFSPIAAGPRISISRRGGAHPSLIPNSE